MSAKSSIKLLVPSDAQGQLFKWVAILTGSKNALKGAGFFLGGVLLTVFGFKGAVLGMAVALLLVWIFSLISLKKDLGKAKSKPKFTEIFSKSRDINYLSAARMFLFGSRDVWFVVALPVYLASEFGWDHWTVGGFLAIWVVGYGFVQGFAPKLTGKSSGKVPDGMVKKMAGESLLADEVFKVLSAQVQELCFYHLEAPIVRVTGWDTPFPHSLEWHYFPSQERVIEAMKKVVEE